MMTLKLAQLESRLQALIEVHLVNLLPGREFEGTLARGLAEAVRNNLLVRADGSRIAPNVYTLIVSPEVGEAWRSASHLVEGLKKVLHAVVSEAGMQFSAPPTITLSIDAGLSRDEVRFVASHKVETVGDTVGMPVKEPAEQTGDSGENIPENAFLIVEGTRIFPLERPVVNIGRRLDNHLVIDDPRVSRSHAQLRAIRGRFVIFDLDSTGGTFVNGQRVSQTILYPGDVISLAGVPLIYGQDNPPPHMDTGETTPVSPSSGERPTAILRPSEEDDEGEE
ncbi:MAG: DUF2662 domain-containing protein [Anaerolineae bacterium]|nr:MAG: DUF2662 domain-containing protein [Anaerolineae bacterium]